MTSGKSICKRLKEIRCQIFVILAGACAATMLMTGCSTHSDLPLEINEKPQNTGKADNMESELRVFEAIDVPPSFPGGDSALMQFLSENFIYPEEAAKDSIEGRVVVKFLVGPDGSVKDAIVVKSRHPLLDEEALRVVKLLPKFLWPQRPVIEDGFWFTLPINFRLQSESGK
ncbi:MAG: energy transducer TonB [Muribaculaceae bacterium]|nr:energy transducer TonB [Muribaculaceae bacterium]